MAPSSHWTEGWLPGDIPAPIIMDAVLCKWYLDIITNGLATWAKFYANDGTLHDNDYPTHLQTALASTEGLFLHVGLHINGWKTKALMIMPTIATSNSSMAAYKCQMEGTGNSYCKFKKYHVTCPLCKMAMQACSLLTHYQAKYPTNPIL